MRVLALSLIAATVAVATPAAAHQWADYFDYGAVELSPKGYRTAAEVAAYVLGHEREYRIVIWAHMDTAEAAEFSDELSERRAQSMASELVRLGVGPTSIQMTGHGDRRLARAAVGREPLNRRLTVDVSLL